MEQKQGGLTVITITLLRNPYMSTTYHVPLDYELFSLCALRCATVTYTPRRTQGHPKKIVAKLN